MSLSHADLVQCCKEILDTYDPDNVAVDLHLNDFLSTLPDLDDTDRTFLEEVFAGCVRFDKILRVVVDGFYNRDGKFILRAEQNLYKVLTYMVFVRLEELGVSQLETFVRSQNLDKMYKFLNFFLDERNLITWIKDEINKCYDEKFIADTIYSPLLERLPDLKRMIVGLKRSIDGAKVAKKGVVPPVVTKPFNLTPLKPVKILIPERIPRLTKSRQVPMTTYVVPDVDIEFEKSKIKNRKKAKHLMNESAKQSPACAAMIGKSDKTKVRMQEIVELEEKKLNFDQRYCNQPPQSILTNVVPIKLNAATILREGRLYRKREEEESKRLDKLESGYGDTREFEEWQSKMRQLDREKEEAELERRRLDGMLSQEEAILAKQKLMEERRRKNLETKAEAEKYMQVFFLRKMGEDEHTRSLVAKVTNVHEGARESKRKIQQYKADKVQEMKQEFKEMMRQALEEAEIEMKQKMDLIAQIKEMESGRSIRQKLVDFTETSGVGLLCEMSTAELRERLQLLKTEEATQEENKRNEINTNKQLKEQMLMETIETITRHRKEISKATATRLEGKKKAVAEKRRPRDEEMEEMERRIEENKTRRKAEKEREKLARKKDLLGRTKESAGDKDYNRTGEEKLSRVELLVM